MKYYEDISKLFSLDSDLHTLTRRAETNMAMHLNSLGKTEVIFEPLGENDYRTPQVFEDNKIIQDIEFWDKVRPQTVNVTNYYVYGLAITKENKIMAKGVTMQEGKKVFKEFPLEKANLTLQIYLLNCIATI